VQSIGAQLMRKCVRRTGGDLLERLNDTKLLRKMAGLASTLLQDAMERSGASIEFTRPLTADETYARECMLAAGEVIAACDQLDYALAYLSGYRSRRTRTGELITRTDYVAFQIENLYFRLVKVSDRCLRLASVVFQLGLQLRDCKTATVVENDHLRGTKVKTRLKAIDKAVSPYRQARNAIAHHSRYSDDDLAQVEMYSILEKTGSLEGDSTLGSMRGVFKVYADRYIDGRREEFEPAVDGLVDEVERFFAALLPHFAARHKALAGRRTSAST